MLIIGTPGEFRDLFQDKEEIRYKTVLRPQTSGPCLSYGPHGCEIPRDDGRCPHLDNPDVVCPIKDVLTAADKQLYADPAPEFIDPGLDDGEGLPDYVAKRVRQAIQHEGRSSLATATGMGWVTSEDAAIKEATKATGAIPLYRDEFPSSARTDNAIKARWYHLRKHPEIVALPDPIAEQPAPEPVEDLDIDERDPDQRVSEIRRPRFRPGDKVRVTKPALRGITGIVKRYYEPTEGYLLALDGVPDVMWIAEEYLEAL